VPGASAYFTGGAIVYTRIAKQELLRLTDSDLEKFRPSTEGHAVILARAVRDRHAVTWGLGETGATGPTGNRYGHAAGHGVFAVAGPVAKTLTVETGSPDREANMRAFGEALLRLFVEALEAAPHTGPQKS
jgi:nicotinamide mononucleotide (NMN) deamidase PncC